MESRGFVANVCMYTYIHLICSTSWFYKNRRRDFKPSMRIILWQQAMISKINVCIITCSGNSLLFSRLITKNCKKL